MIGDIIAVSGGDISPLWVICSVFFIFLLMRKWRILASLSIFGILLGFGYGYITYANRVDQVRFMEQDLHIFAGKKHVVGTIDDRIFSKERSTTYRLILDSIDSISTSDVAIQRGQVSIFVEVPTNLRLASGDRISFTGTITKNIHFPLLGYERFAFVTGGYGSSFVPLFQRFEHREAGWLTRIRGYSVEVFRSGFPKEVSGVLLGMVMGIDQYLESTVKDAFMKSGITHILVVSGSNIAFLILFLMFFLKYSHLGRWGRIAIVGSTIVFYGFLVGWEISVVRATLMGILSYFVAEYGGRVSSIATLIGAAFILTIYSPLSPLYDAGFGLSFGATAGIFIFREPLKNLWERTRFPPSWLPFFSLSLGATLGSLPILIYHFGTISLGSVVINILIESVLGWILFTSVLYIPLNFLSHSLAYYFGYLIYFPTKYILMLSAFFSLSYTVSVPESIRAPIALCLLGIYCFLLLKKDIFDTILIKSSTPQESNSLIG